MNTTQKRLDLIYSTVYQPENWQLVIDMMRELSNSRGATFHLAGTNTASVPASFHSGHSQSEIDSYNRSHVSEDVIYKFFKHGAIRSPSIEFRDSAMFPDIHAQNMKSELYETWARPNDIASVVTLASVNPLFTLGVALQQSHRVRKEIDIRSLNFFAGHITRAASMQTASLIFSTSDRNHSVALVSKNHEIIEVGPLFKSTIEMIPGSIRIVGSKLVLFSESLLSGFCSATKTPTNPKLNAFPTTVKIDSLDAVFTITFCPSDDDILIHIDTTPVPGFAAMAQYGLTPIERKLLVALARGSSLRTLAEQANRSLNTIKTQHQSILRKLQLNSQRELVRKFGSTRIESHEG